MKDLLKRPRKGSLVHTTRGSRPVRAMCERRVEVSPPKTARILTWKVRPNSAVRFHRRLVIRSIEV
jgi:hypothetical protein